jgi:tetratricopeptide (TPR) repeat protein
MRAGSSRQRITPAAASYTLLLLVVAVFNPVFGNGFINFDDPVYVSRNPMVQAGFTWDSLRWAFTSFDAANWHPLTWLSHLLDTRLFGTLPFGSHLMNVVYHATATALLFMLLQRLTGAFWAAYATATLFAIHPLRVESVAWAAERKDVLSACFWMLTLLAYTRYVRRPGAGRYALAVAVFALGLLAKPMLVTLPLILLLLDWWPLGRTRGPGPQSVRVVRLILEKLPLLVLSGLSAVITFHAQTVGGAVVPLTTLSIGKRLANAAVALLVYLSKIAWPEKLSMFYARPSGGIGLMQGGGAVLLLILITVAAAVSLRRRPYLLAGWIWYLIALLPVLGIVQVGYQPWADRYTYIPSIGIVVSVTWLFADLSRPHRRARFFLVGAAAALALVLSVATQRYISAWSNGESLFRRALAAGGDTYMMRFCLGGELVQAGKVDEAIVQFTLGFAKNPFYADGHFGMAVALDIKGNTAKAAQHYRQAMELDPGKAEIHVFFGSLLERNGDQAGAELHFREALRLQPRYAAAQEGVCRIQSGAGKVFAVPLFPWCRERKEYWKELELLDKPAPGNYVQREFEWLSGAVAE